MFEVILIGFFVLGALGLVGVLVAGVVKRLRGRDSEDWRDDPAAGDAPKVRPGPGWGNGGSWN